MKLKRLRIRKYCIHQSFLGDPNQRESRSVEAREQLPKCRVLLLPRSLVAICCTIMMLIEMLCEVRMR